MSGRLSEEHKDQLESWIGTGPKTFALLYSITRDGCVNTTFHQKCDGQGPTVTVLYNPQGSIYGGYTSVSWSSSDGQYVLKDDNAFLFQLQFSGNKKLNKFMCTKNPQYAIYNNPSRGPTFGGGHELYTFHDTVNVSNGVFSLNGGMNFGHSYDTLGMKAGDINNGTMNVTDLEVYKITDGQRSNATSVLTKPWRKVPDVIEKNVDKLKEEVENFKPMTDIGISEFKILMLGPVGSGKSSFFNTIDSIFRGRISHRAACGNPNMAVTSAFAQYDIMTKSGSALKFRLCDSPGIREEGLGEVTEFSYIIDGHMPDLYEFNQTIPLKPTSPLFVQKPSVSDQIHCAAIVLDASAIGNTPSMVQVKVNHFMKMLLSRKIPYAILLTKIDKISDDIKDDASKAFVCSKVEKAVMDAAELLCVPRNRVHPVKNYEDELALSDDVSCLALMALQQLLYLAEDNLLNLRSKIRGQRTAALQQEISEVTESNTA